MKARLRHISAFGLAALVLFSTFSFTVEMHYCGKHLVDLAINTKAEGCAMSMENPEGESQPGHDKDMPCCEDVQLTIDGQEDLQKATFSISLEPQFIAVLSAPYSFLSQPFVPKAKVNYTDYFPPPLVRDIPILHQAFLI